MDHDNARVFQMLESGDIALSQPIEEAFLMMGMTKRGKTTLGHHLCNQQLQGYKVNGELMYKATTRNYKNALIGATGNSQTEIPNYFFPKMRQGKDKLEKLTLIDCPGFEDSYGVHRVITNAYFNYRVFSKVSKIKFILVLQAQDLTSPCTDLYKTMKGFLQNFKDYDLIKKDIMEATSLVISKTTVQTKQHIAKLKGIIEDVNTTILSTQQKKHFAELIEHLIEKKKIFTFRAAQDKVLSQQNTLLKDIDTASNFWEREKVLGQDIVDMSSINFGIFKEIQKNETNNQQYKNSWESLMNHFNSRNKEVIQGIQRVFSSLIEDAISLKEDDCKFLSEMQLFLKRQQPLKQQFETERTTLKKSLFQPDQQQRSTDTLANNENLYWIKKMRTVEEIYNEFFQISDEVNIRNYRWIQARGASVVKLIKSFNKLTNNAQKVLILDFGYVIFRMFEQLKVFFLLLSGEEKNKQVANEKVFDSIQPLKDAISGIFTQPLDELKKSFALNYVIKENLEPRIYNEYLVFYRTIGKGTNDVQLRKLKDKETRLILNSTQYVLTRGNATEKLRAIRDLNECRKDLEEELKYNPEDQQQGKARIQSVVRVMRILGEFLVVMNYREAAIICFESINFIPRILQIYAMMIDANGSTRQKRKTLINMAEYASKHGRVQLGIQKLQEAYDLSEKYDEFREISDLIIQQSTGSLTDKANSYLKNIMDKKFYRSLSYEDSQMLQQLAQMAQMPN